MHRGSSSNAVVLNSGASPRQAANRCREQGNHGPITHAFEVDTGYFRCQEHRSFYPYFNYEVVKVQTTDRNASMPGDTFYILNFPIDQLSEHLMEEATQLNLRNIALCNPLSREVFMNNYDHILAMTLNILRQVPSLTRITLCADILNDALFDSLSYQSHLREVEILLPSSTFPGSLAHIGAVLNRGFALLTQVEYFKVPLEIIHSFPPTVDHLTLIP